ncbi:hypothetical protein HYALB_00005711 [Hymenoscyphus albidus]|uniref:C2H2-type domain-containing protein n=1 Tax=Hymenoscyphus albidus TaxID=595503 RepID=A0A9N9Q1P4_9HELO|nr:hypothetical protein HYALB_00005711 [Hymenoscyphus albidus]
MSSLKDIMDVDVEPLQSQAYRKSREAAQQSASRPSIAISTEVPSPPTDDEEEDQGNNNQGKHPIKRRRSHRVPNDHTESSLSTYQNRRNSVTEQIMNMDYQNSYQTVGSSQGSSSGTPQMSRTSESDANIPVKYTPVTGRISRAKKGVPVHTCDICRPAKTFTRAEHLRRHRLSHQKPAYGCEFENCERAFHRPDLLARHMHRHETQGEKAYVSGDPERSRASSSASESQPRQIKTEPGRAYPQQGSPMSSNTPRTSMSGETNKTMSSTNTITPQSFQAGSYSPGSNSSHKRSAREAELPDMDSYPVTSPIPNRMPTSFVDTLAPGTDFTSANLPGRENMYTAIPSSGFENMYAHESFSANYTTAVSNSGLPLLRIPDEPFPPHQSFGQDNSPWCSSASDSTYSNHSDGSRAGRQWTSRGRSDSLVDWPISATSQSLDWSTPQDLHSPPFDTYLDQQYEAHISPRTTHMHLDVPSPFRRYNMETVGTPTLSTNSKPISQAFPASSSRIPNPRLAGINAPREDELAVFSSTSTNLEQQTPSLDLCIDSYWQNFHPLLPFIHRPTYNTVEGSLLTSAIAAIGTQYHNTPEARARGTELNEFCRGSIERRLELDRATMQAILLTEVFSRFRGRKTTIRLSRRFEDLCMRLISGTDPSYRAPSTCTSPVEATSVDDLRTRFGSIENSHSLPKPDASTEWMQWVERESQQRLLSSCFVFDVHQALYHKQLRARAFSGEVGSFLHPPCLDSIWNASDHTEWKSQSLQLLAPGASTQQFPPYQSSFLQSIVMSSHAIQLQFGETPTYLSHFHTPSSDYPADYLMNEFSTSPVAQTYLALHYTPLHDLLAVAADTWIFSQKVTPPERFHSAQIDLGSWSRSAKAAHAVHHACRILSINLAQWSDVPSNSCHSNGIVCITNYWSLYMAALICWAYGHRFQQVVKDTSPSQSMEEAIQKANTYVNGMLALSVEELINKRATVKGKTAGVIDLVYRRLVIEGAGIGGRCSMLTDCTQVLQKIAKSGKSKWF